MQQQRVCIDYSENKIKIDKQEIEMNEDRLCEWERSLDKQITEKLSNALTPYKPKEEKLWPIEEVISEAKSRNPELGKIELYDHEIRLKKKLGSS